VPLVLGIDIGTTSTAAILIDVSGKVLAQGTRPVALSSPQPGWAEEDPEAWWANVCDLVPELLAAAGVGAEEVRGVGITGMLPAVILMDAEGRLLRPSIQQSDARCAAEVAELAAEYPEDAFVAKAGNGINQQLVACKLRWIEAHEPGIFARIGTVFGSYDYINWRLTGVRAVEQNWALEAGFVDLASLALSDALIALAHVPRAAIPPRSASHQVLGAVTATAARATGLSEGTPVVAGAADHVASAYAAGITRPGDVLLKFGGSTDILIATAHATPDRRLFLDQHVQPGLFMPNGCMASGGSALNWFVDRIATGAAGDARRLGISPHQHLDRIAAATPPGADGVQIIPYFLGEKTPIHDAGARGIIQGLSLNHDVRHLWRALLEGFGYCFRHHVEVFNDIGYPTTRYSASDGGASSRLWMQICADILQQPVQLLVGHPGSCLGAAWLAAVGTGLSTDWQGVTQFVSLGEHIMPDPANAALYDAGYRRFRDSYEALARLRRQTSA
jgi:xylulokinase